MNTLQFTDFNLDKNKYLIKNIYVKYIDNINGYGLFTNKFLYKNELIYSLPTICIPSNSIITYTFKTNERKYVDMIVNSETHLDNEMYEFTYFDIFINSSCNPNAYYKSNINNDQNVVALNYIQKDEQIFVDYDCLDWISTDPFKCNCNSQQCVKYKRGFAYLPVNIQQQYLNSNIVSDYVRNYYNNHKNKTKFENLL